ncbi:hypothetical protein DW655_07285 [Lachnospiraceae bacterium AM23-2LB]|nr:hypothetical protein DW655_07285 [Lachnospiraceae bacterium AM23-2LB]RJW05271.1 hypothetical protein DW887_00940 [Lachnospiraceae bacterium AM40-2BH]
MKHAAWKYRLCEKLYCNPQWNCKLMCLKCSFDEVCRILNTTRKCPGSHCSGGNSHPCRGSCK